MLVLAGNFNFSTAQAAARKVLVVTTTTGFRHSSIETAEKIIAELGEKSGAFTVDYARVTPPSVVRKPNAPKPTGNEKRDAANKKRFDEDMAKFKAVEPETNAALKKYADEQKAVLFELVKLASGPPDPVVRPKLQMALEEFAPHVAKPAMANPVLRANVLIPDVRYGVREEMKSQFGLNWRGQVREVNLTLDVAANRHFRVRIESELARLQAKFAPRLEPGFAIDPKLTRGTQPAVKRLPNIIVAAANQKGEIVRYYEADDTAAYFGSPFARDSATGLYDAARESRAIASIGKIVAAITIANSGQDTAETLWNDSAAPDTGLETCRKGTGVRGRAARVSFACSLNKPIEWRAAQAGQEKVRRIIDALGLTMPPALNASEATPPSTAAVRGLVTASPRKVHQMAAVVLASLTGDGRKPVPLPALVRNFDLNDAQAHDPSNRASEVVPDEVIRPEARGLLRTLLQAPLCYRVRDTHHGTLKALSNWCAERRSDLKLHFAKTGTHVTEDPDAIVDTWITGGIQFANGAAYSYVVLVGTGSSRQPFARKLHSGELAGPLAELMLQELAGEAARTIKIARAPAKSPSEPAIADTREEDLTPARPPASDPLKARQGKQLWWQDQDNRKRIFGDRS